MGDASYHDSAEALADHVVASSPRESDASKAAGSAETTAQCLQIMKRWTETGAYVERDDPAAVRELQLTAEIGWAQYKRVCAEAARADADPVVKEHAQRAIAQAHEAAMAIGLAASRATERAAARAREVYRRSSARDAHRPLRRPMMRLVARSRAPARRRVRLAAAASAGSGGDDPGPEPSLHKDRARHASPKRRRS